MTALQNRKSMLLLFLLALPWERLPQAEGGGIVPSCNSELGNCDRVWESCEQEHPERGLQRLQTCFRQVPEGSSVLGSSGTNCRYQPCDGESTAPSGVFPRVLGGQKLTVTLHHDTPVEYSATISWTTSYSTEFHTGYKVAVYTKYSSGMSYGESTACSCLPPNVRNYTFHGLRYRFTSFKFTVTSLPYSDNGPPFTISKEIDSPRNCRSLPTYDPLRCGPPEYGQVTHLQAVTEHIKPEDDQPRMRLMLSWQHPVINTTHFPLPSTYYLVLVDKNSSYSTTQCGDNPLCFKTNGTLKVMISPLDPYRKYKVVIRAYMNCSGIEDSDSRGCSDKKEIYISPPPPLPPSSTLLLLPSSTSLFLPSSTPLPSVPSSTLLPTSTLLPSPHTSTPSQDTTTSLQTHESPEPLSGVAPEVVGLIVTGLALLLLLITGIAVLVAVRRERRKHNSKMNQVPLPLYPIPTSGSIETTNIVQVQNSTDPLDPVNDRQGTCVSECRQSSQKSTCFLQNKKDNPLVLVIYSPNSSEKDKRLVWQYLVRDLAKYDDGSRRIQIESYDSSRSSLRNNVSAWLVDNFKKASAVLCVCDAQFRREWDQQNPLPFCALIFSLRELVYATLSVCTSPSSKFAVVLLRQSDHQHIPEYLNSTKCFLVDEVKEIGRFVYEVPKCVNPDVNGHS